MLIDSHAHITDPSLEEEREALLLRAKKAGVSTIINIATNPEELTHGLALASIQGEAYPSLYVAGSTTPHDAEKEGELHFAAFAKAAREGKLIAIGETGLDYHYYRQTASIQKHIFRKYLSLAQELNYPVIVHCRDAFADLFAILDEMKNPPKGVLHCFTGNQSEAKELVERGWYLSFSGIVTFKKSHELREIAQSIPIKQLLIETDTPYLAPSKYRGKRNEPAYLAETASCLASLRGMTFDELSGITSENAKTFFNL